MKTQMRFQKILTLVSLVTAALSFVLAVFYCSGIIYQSQAYTSVKNADSTTLGNNVINADALYEYTQSANNTLVILAIVFILVITTLYITSTNKRRNYYITNYISIALVVIYSTVFAIILFSICSQAAVLAGQIDMAKWQELVAEFTTDRYGNKTFVNPQNYSESYITVILGFILGVVIIVEVAAWVLNTVWKIKMMKGEKALLAGNISKEVA